MVTNKTSDTGVLYGAAVPLLGIGLCLPIIGCDSMRTALVLGLAGALALVLTVVVIGRVGHGLPGNIRIGLAAFTGAAMTILAGMAAALLPPGGNVPFLIVVPFVIPAAVLIADAPPVEPKKKMTRTLVEAIIMGLGFAALLCILGGVRGVIDKSVAAASMPAALHPLRFFASVPGVLILLALPAAVARRMYAKGKGEAA